MHKSFLALCAAATAAVALVIPGDAPDPKTVTIKGVAYGGSGCPQNSLGEYISQDQTTFTLIFDSFFAQTGPGTTPSEGREACQINLELDYPSGFQYSILSTTYRGYAALDSRVTGTLSALYYFSGANQQQVQTQTVFQGPTDQSFTASSNVGIASVVWSPCGAELPLNIKTSLSVFSTNPNAKGLLEDDTLDGDIQFVTGVQWQRCTVPA